MTNSRESKATAPKKKTRGRKKKAEVQEQEKVVTETNFEPVPEDSTSTTTTTAPKLVSLRDCKNLFLQTYPRTQLSSFIGRLMVYSQSMSLPEAYNRALPNTK